MPRPMPTCVLVCETCGVHQPFIIYEEELAEVQNGKPVPKPCPTCHKPGEFYGGHESIVILIGRPASPERSEESGEQIMVGKTETE